MQLPVARSTLATEKLLEYHVFEFTFHEILTGVGMINLVKPALVSTLALLAAVAFAERPEPEVHGTFFGDDMYTLLPPDGIPAITHPEYVTGEEAVAQMMPEEPVIGVFDGDDAVCWSTWQLDHHEIVNDVLAGKSIAATW